MKYRFKIAAISVLLFLPLTSNAQVLITLLFGDALNTEKIEFGLVGGLNRSYILDIEDSKGLNNFNLGMGYQHNKMSAEFRVGSPREMLSNYTYFSGKDRSLSPVFGYTLF